jgi:Ca2+:H+ antiporter
VVNVSRLKPSLNWLLVLVPVSLVADFGLHLELLTFLTAAGAIIPLAGLIGRGTEQLAVHAGQRIGGLLNASFGNVTELIIAIFLILRGELDVVKASLTGSILGNLLLVLGMSFLIGGLRHEQQTYNRDAAGVHSNSLALAVIGLLMPALFVISTGRHDVIEREVVSTVVALVLILLYGSALVFTQVTHDHLFHVPATDEKAEWSARTAVLVLLAATAVVALESELLVSSLEPALASMGLSKFFVGLILVPLIGNAAEHSSAITFAIRNQMDVTLEIAIGSSVQIALFVAPLLVFLSLATGHPMDFVFTPFEVAAVGLSTIIVTLVVVDGRSNWLEGAQLVGAYAIMAVSFFFVRSG